MAHQVGYFWCKLKISLLNKIQVGRKRYPEKEILPKWFRKHGVKIGDGCCIYSNILTPESYLISIGNYVTISNNVQLITHDNSIDKVLLDRSDILGEITIGDNCFIGAHSIILPGVTLGNNTIVGAGSVVTKSFTESEIIIAGNPAKIVGSWNKFGEKYKNIAFDFSGGKLNAIKKHPNQILKNRS